MTGERRHPPMLFPAFAVTAVLWITSRNEPSLWQVALAFLLALIPCWAYAAWVRDGTSRLPLFAIVAWVHWIFFAVPLFWGGRYVDALIKRRVSEGAITSVLELTVLGVGCLWLGMHLKLPFLSPERLPDIPIEAGHRDYLHLVLALSIVMSFLVSPYLFGEAGRQIVLILQTVVPATIFAMLFRQALSGQTGQRDILLLAAFVVSSALLGVASGWLGSLAKVGVVCAAVYVSVRRRIPWVALVLAATLMVFFQVGKTSFREAYWYGTGQGGTFEKIGFWTEESWSRWSDALTSGKDEQALVYARQTLDRTSLLIQAGNVVELTPSVVPFQEGRTYAYMLVTLIPRFLWPEKPDVNEANRFYQIRYGLSDVRSLGRVSISAGILAEGYMNFGWIGAAGIMFLVGVILGLIERTLFSPESGLLWTSLGIALLTPLITIESQVVQYFGGLAQHILLTLLILLPAGTYRRQPLLESDTTGFAEPVIG